MICICIFSFVFSLHFVSFKFRKVETLKPLRNAFVMVLDLECQGNGVGFDSGIIDQNIWSGFSPAIVVSWLWLKALMISG